MRFKNKTILVTGGSAGIGRAIVLKALAEGASVAFCGRSRERGLGLLKDCGDDPRLCFIQADVREEKQARDLVEQCLAWTGALDIVVNNVGAGARHAGVEKTDPPTARFQKMIKSNLDVAYFVATSALPYLAQSAVKRGSGAIINITSTASLHGTWGHYGVAKAALEALTRSLAVEGAPKGVRVNAVSPGWIKTFETAEEGKSAAWERQASLFGRMGQPDEIACATLFLASDDASFITGTTLVVDGGLSITDPASQTYLAEHGGWRLFSGVLAP
ncbi:SDR family NAD(P)-dependent oxidoreductase [Limibacillus halophilus]|uniref:NAD(P)-dependent dehydrogenase (Short-subunit alcohol dehydrogenase family) n=1 Tax=Limibacillus halophilus TaxID=1579333 RepID=A0A839SQS4_9PROT|nr:SDR family NAD(P)-dependent oxidoreductase [Limibacillus halophilus]MBB3064174.1 NAD(P)-dependent dehydrogenase (short-subunit alcohol dehydrogenase family) [Limibacillus halophilus]